MKKFLLLSILSAALGSTAMAQDNGDVLKSATQIARDTLAKQLNADAATLTVLSSQAQTWPDSSLGCGKPGSMASQVVTSGYEFVFKTAHGNYRVHATGKHAVVCGPATEWRSPRRSVPLRNLNPMIDRARADVANKLSVPLSDVRTLNFMPMTWPDTSMDCNVAGEVVEKRPTKGYRIALGYRDRVFTYHTDLTRVRACPPIENE